MGLTMPEAFYEVTSNGSIRPGFTQDQVKKNLIESSHLSQDIVTSLFSHPQTIIETNLDFADACKCEQSLFLKGLIVKCESMAVNVD